MMLNAPLALIYRELLLMPRRRFFYWKRVGFVALLSLIIASSASGNLDSAWLGLKVFTTLTIAVFVAIGLIAPSSAATVVSREKELHTLELLLLTDLSPLEIIISKFFAQIFYLLISGLSCLPLLMICIGMGGISAEQILAAVAITLAFLLLATAIGIFVATQEKGNNAQIPAIAMTAGILYCTSMASVMSLGFSAMSGKWLTALSPVLALVKAVEGKDLVIAFAGAVFPLILVVPLLWIAGKLLPYIYFYRQLPAASAPKKSPKKPKLAPKKIRKRRPPLQGNPITWHDYHLQARRMGLDMGIVKVILLVEVLGALVSACSKQLREVASVIFAILFFTMLLLAALTMFEAALRSFAREKEQKHFDLLLLTGLTNWEIICGKLQAILRLPLSFLVIGFGAGIICVLFYPRIICREFFYYAAYAISYLSTACILALSFSLRCRSLKQTFVYTLLVMVVWHSLSNLLYFNLIGSHQSWSHSLHLVWAGGYALLSGVLLQRSTSRLRF